MTLWFWASPAVVLFALAGLAAGAAVRLTAGDFWTAGRGAAGCLALGAAALLIMPPLAAPEPIASPPRAPRASYSAPS